MKYILKFLFMFGISLFNLTQAQADCNVFLPDPDNFEVTYSDTDYGNKCGKYFTSDPNDKRCVVILSGDVHSGSADEFYITIKDKRNNISCQIHHSAREATCDNISCVAMPSDVHQNFTVQGADPNDL